MNIGFTSSLSLDNHPLISTKSVIKSDYYNALFYFTTRQKNDVLVRACIEDYRLMLGVDVNFNKQNLVKSAKGILTRFNLFWNGLKYLLCFYVYLYVFACYYMCYQDV